MPCRPSEALHATIDAAPCPLVVGGPSNGKQRVNEQPSEPSQTWEAICLPFSGSPLGGAATAAQETATPASIADDTTNCFTLHLLET